MIGPYELIRSVELVWLVWLASALGLVWSSRRMRGQPLRAGIRALVRDEEGAAYSLSYVLTFPIYLLLVCAIVQSSTILVVKMGTVYASFAAARSAAVWLSAEPASAAEGQVRRAAVHAMVPFASSNSAHLKRLGASGGGVAQARQYHNAYLKYSENGPAPEKYTSAKFRCAEAATTATWTPGKPRENEDVTLTLTYRMPLSIPWFARLVGHDDGIYPIETQVTLQNEGPKGADRHPSGRPLGIDYHSL